MKKNQISILIFVVITMTGIATIFSSCGTQKQVVKEKVVILCIKKKSTCKEKQIKVPYLH